jgi:hypothetical protein
MSYKTDRLTKLFPDAYGAKDTASLLYQILDSVGAELMDADESIKNLLKSHWVDFANGTGLDGLGAIFGVTRRLLVDGSPEPDSAFRLRLKSVVPLFTGGGTRRAVLGAVRSALGFPFDLAQLHIPAQFSALQQDLENLVNLVEFSPKPERLVSEITDPSQAGSLLLDVPIVSVKEEVPRFEWLFTRGGARRLRLELVGSGLGVLSEDSLVVPQGVNLILSADSGGQLRAFLGTSDVSASFHSLDGGLPVLPAVPRQPNQWRFTAEGALYNFSVFDQSDTFDKPLFRIQMTWRSYEPLTFDVFVPFFLKNAVDALKAQYNYTGEIFIFEGLDLKIIQQVVDQTRAAGVRGSVQYSLNFRDDHDQRETFLADAAHRQTEDADQAEEMATGSISNQSEDHDLNEAFSFGGVFNFSRFDSVFAFT